MDAELGLKGYRRQWFPYFGYTPKGYWVSHVDGVDMRE
jgi:hypothetical protein